MPLANAIGHLVDPKLLASKCVSFDIGLSKPDVGRYYWVGSSNKCTDVLGDTFFQDYESFWQTTQSLLLNLNTNQMHMFSHHEDYYSHNLGNLSRSVRDFTSLLHKFLKKSLCVLPQDQAIFSETEQSRLILSAVESQLITWKLR